jgi:hypothetical protein
LASKAGWKNHQIVFVTDKTDKATSLRQISINCDSCCIEQAGNTKGGSITVALTSCLTGLESVVQQLTIFVFICKTD